MRSRFILFVFLALMLPLSACAPRAIVPVEVPPGMEVLLLQQIEQNAGTFHSLEGLARVRISGEGKSFSSTQVLLAEKPNRFRAETLSPFGQPVLTVATDGHELSAFVPSERLFYRGESSLRNVQRFTRMPLQLEDLVHILLYDVPILSYQFRSVASTARGGYLLTLLGPGETRQEMIFDRDLRLSGASYFQGVELLLRITYDRFGSEGFPASASLEMPAQNAEASLVFSDLRTNVSIAPERFQMHPPQGIEEQPFP
jgi:outer membrane lipoprotein-sorting protein